MTSRTTKRFRGCLLSLPVHIRRQAREAYKLFRQNPRHPSLQFKRVHARDPVFSVRISRNYRAAGVVTGEDILWFWIGAHGEYEKLLKSL